VYTAGLTPHTQLLEQVWQQLSQTFVEQYARLEKLAGTQFGETLSPSSDQLAAALRDAASSH